MIIRTYLSAGFSKLELSKKDHLPSQITVKKWNTILANKDYLALMIKYKGYIKFNTPFIVNEISVSNFSL